MGPMGNDYGRAVACVRAALFWTPSAAAYTNDLIVGALAIAFSVLVPMMPGMSHEGTMDESEIPPGWTSSPSSWIQNDVLLQPEEFLLAAMPYVLGDSPMQQGPRDVVA